MTTLFAFANVLDTETVTSSGDASGYSHLNAFDGNTYDSYKPDAAPAWLKASGSGVACDYFGIAAHNLADVSGTIVLQYSDNDTDWTNAFTPVTPTDNSPILRTFTQSSHDYWRTYITGGTPNIGVLKFGARLDLPADNGMSAGFAPIHMMRRDLVLPEMSAGGHRLGVVIKHRAAGGTIAIERVAESWLDSNWETLADALQSGLVFFQWDDENQTDEVVLCWAERAIKAPQYTHYNKQSIRFDVGALR